MTEKQAELIIEKLGHIYSRLGWMFFWIMFVLLSMEF